MSGGVDYVNLDPLPLHGTVFRRDRDPSFPLQLHGVHDSFIDFQPRPEDSALPEHVIHKGCFAMINMRDDRNISNFFVTYFFFHCMRFHIYCINGQTLTIIMEFQISSFE